MFPRNSLPHLLFAVLTLISFTPMTALANEDSESMTAEEFMQQLHFQQGKVSLENGLATLNLGTEYRYLNPEDSSKVLQAWGNPPGEEPLGMIFPAQGNIFSETSWGVVVTFEEDGYVKDDEAATIDYSKLLQEMQTSIKEANNERVKAGYEKLDLVGWAEQPHYDKATHKLFWAKELKFGDATENTLNYNIRALGRRGVLVLNAVSSMKQLSAIKGNMQDVVAMVEFNPGHRYLDFDSKTDKVAAYGIAALVAGKVAAKAGFFKIILGGILAAKKLLVVLVFGAIAAVKRLFSGKAGEMSN